MSIHIETPLKPRWEIVVILCVFLCVCFFPFVGIRELFGRESEFAAIATEISFSAPWPIAQGELLPYRYPLFPLLVKSFMNLGLTPEWAVRLIALFAISGITLFTYLFSIRALKRTDAGAIAAIVVLTNAFVIDRGLWGYPEMLGYAFIHLGWFLWFHFGMMEHKWTLAWTASTAACLLSFATIGPGGALLFVIPLFFMNRPISGRYRLASWGGILSVCAFLIWVMMWELARKQGGQEASDYNTIFGIFNTTHAGVLWRILAPFDVVIRFLPWSLFIYPVFCPAYKQFETNPVFTNYMRNIFVVCLVMIVIIPWFRVADDIRILIPLLGYLVAVHYPVFIRRNGGWISRLLKPVKAVMFLASLLLLLYHFFFPVFAQFLQQNSSTSRIKVSNEILLFFENLWMQFGMLEELKYVSIGIASCCLLLSLILMSRPGRALPLWAQIGLTMATLSLLYWGSNAHRRLFDRSQTEFAFAITDAIRATPDYASTPIRDITLYKDPHSPSFYAELVYSGAKIKKMDVDALDQLNVDTILYFSDDVPKPLSNYRWDEKPVIRLPHDEKSIFVWRAYPMPTDTEMVQPETETILLLP